MFGVMVLAGPRLVWQPRPLASALPPSLPLHGTFPPLSGLSLASL